MSGYSEFKFWSAMLGCDASRISMCNDRFGEFYMIIPDEGGRKYKEARDHALEAIESAISLGLDPGEVIVTGA